MTETTQTCLRGCTYTDHHTTDCEDQDTCRGCLPRAVEPGAVLCSGCKSRAIRALMSFGDLAHWIRENVHLGTKGDPRDVNVVARAWAPLSIEALTDLDEMATLVANWVMLGVEEHPAGLHGPDWIGARVTPASKRINEGGEVRYDQARVVGVRAGHDGTIIATAAEWLRSWADWYSAQPWADEWHDELTKGSRLAQAKWPQIVRARKSPLPCPSQDCDQLSLWWHPAPEQGADATIICHNDACGRRLTEADYWVQVMAKRNTLPREAA